MRGRQRGALSAALEAALLGFDGRPTYRDVLRMVTADVTSRVTDQHPQIETTDATELDRPFLGGAIPATPRPLTLSRLPDGWSIDSGAVHGVPEPIGDDTTELAVYPLTGETSGSPLATALGHQGPARPQPRAPDARARRGLRLPRRRHLDPAGAAARRASSATPPARRPCAGPPTHADETLVDLVDGRDGTVSGGTPGGPARRGHPGRLRHHPPRRHAPPRARRRGRGPRGAHRPRARARRPLAAPLRADQPDHRAWPPTPSASRWTRARARWAPGGTLTDRVCRERRPALHRPSHEHHLHPAVGGAARPHRDLRHLHRRVPGRIGRARPGRVDERRPASARSTTPCGRPGTVSLRDQLMVVTSTLEFDPRSLEQEELDVSAVPAAGTTRSADVHAGPALQPRARARRHPDPAPAAEPRRRPGSPTGAPTRSSSSP